jgi:hypothetical protein
MMMTNIQGCILADGKYEKLDKINQYHVHNAWFEVFYAGCKYGACPVEALHALENGLIKQSLWVLFVDNMNGHSFFPHYVSPTLHMYWALSSREANKQDPNYSRTGPRR